MHVGDVSRSLQLAFLAPDLVEAILDGTQPVALTPERLKRALELPLLWHEQRAMLGVGELEGGDLRLRSGAGSDARRASWLITRRLIAVVSGNPSSAAIGPEPHTSLDPAVSTTLIGLGVLPRTPLRIAA